jgi:ferritin-like metal-binding protein YciE
MKLSTLHSLYIEELRDLYSAATQVMRSLPKIARAPTRRGCARR